MTDTQLSVPTVAPTEDFHLSYGQPGKKPTVVEIDLDSAVTKATAYRFANAFVPGTMQSVRAKFTDQAQHAAIKEVLDEIEASRRLGIGENRLQGATDILLAINTRWGTFFVYELYAYKGADKPAQRMEMISFRAPERDSGAVCLPVTVDGDIVMVGQYRFQVGGFTIELPRGSKRADESFEKCAIREAGEESGVKTTEASKVIYLGRVAPNTGILQEQPHIYAVTHVNADGLAKPDNTESITGRIVLTAQRVREMIYSGEITCGFTMAAVLRAEYSGLLPK